MAPLDDDDIDHAARKRRKGVVESMELESSSHHEVLAVHSSSM